VVSAEAGIKSGEIEQINRLLGMTNEEIIEVCKKHTAVFTVQGVKIRALNLLSLGIVDSQLGEQISEVIRGKPIHVLLTRIGKNSVLLRSLTSKINLAKIDPTITNNRIILDGKISKQEMRIIIEACM